MASVVDKELIYYFTRLDEQQKKSLPEMMKSFLRYGDSPVQPATIAQYNRELDEAMGRISKASLLR